VGVAFLIFITLALVNLLNQDVGAGFRGVPAGRMLPVFAAPLTSSGLDNDASIQPRNGGGHPAACSIRLAGVVNLCDLRRRPLVITFIANGGAGCGAQLGRVDRVRRAFPGVTFIGVISHRSLSEAAAIVRKGGWTMPVVLDRDAAVFNLYGIGDCPETIFAYRGGRSAGTRRGPLGEVQLRAAASQLVRGPRK
jgi:hypothetical protein